MSPYLNSLFDRSRRLFITLAKVMVPVMLAVRIADQLGLIDMVSGVLTPVMSLIGMPPEAGLIWASCLFINLYGAVAVIAGLAPHLDMTSAQLSALCAMMLFAHVIPRRRNSSEVGYKFRLRDSLCVVDRGHQHRR